MSFEDKSLECSDCGITFTHSVEDQELPRMPSEKEVRA
jgi:hypothetical protein